MSSCSRSSRILLCRSYFLVVYADGYLFNHTQNDGMIAHGLASTSRYLFNHYYKEQIRPSVDFIIESSLVNGLFHFFLSATSHIEPDF